MLTPDKDKLFRMTLKEAAEFYGKSERTIRRWQEKLGVYQPQDKYRPGKLSKEKAAQIRRLERKGWTQQEIAAKFGVSQTMVGRVINNLAYKLNFSLTGAAEVLVVFAGDVVDTSNRSKQTSTSQNAELNQS